MKDTTKEALINAKRAIEEAHRAALREALEDTQLTHRILEHVHNFTYWAQQLDHMVSGPRFDQQQQGMAVPSPMAMREAVDAPRGPAW